MRANHYLLVFDGGATATRVEDLGSDVGAALEAYERRERETPGRVVLIGADSLDTLKETHSSYFGAGTRVTESLTA